MMFSGIYLLFAFLAAAWSVVTYFFGIQRVKQAVSYMEVAVIAFVVFLAQVLPGFLFALFTTGSLMGAGLGMMLSMFGGMVLVAGITTYLTVFGILASCYYVFGEPDGEL
jgi:hypothetical protein